MASNSVLSEDSPPAAKRKKLDLEGDKATDITSEFPIRNLEDFYKTCPTYRLPVEIGSFSLDEKGVQQLDRSQLRFLSPPPTASRLNFDLKVGYEKYVPSQRSVPADKLNPILRWIAMNGDCFRPKMFSPEKSKEGDVAGEMNRMAANGQLAGAERRVSVGDNIIGPTLTAKDRPDNLLTNFVTWRGMLTKMLCSPYNKTEPWKVAATLHRGTIYLSEIETEESKKKNETQSERMKEMSYWGVKFEDYVSGPEPPAYGRPDTPSTPSPRMGTVNSNRAFCTVVRTRMNTHSIVMAAEVDCCDHLSKAKPPQNYIELKTNRVILTDRNKSSFRRYKLMKWWAQSFLVGIPKIVCGFRDDDGVVKNVQHFKTSMLAHECQNDLTMWQPAVCLNFLDGLLTWIRSVVVSEGSKEVYLLEWKEPFVNITCTKCPPDNECAFLPDWFVNKLLPPPPKPSSTGSSTPTSTSASIL